MFFSGFEVCVLRMFQFDYDEQQISIKKSSRQRFLEFRLVGETPMKFEDFPFGDPYSKSGE